MIKKKYIEIVCYFLFVIIITANAVFAHDCLYAVFAALFGILYTILAGHGKAICYLFGLLGGICYCILIFKNKLYGSLSLYIFYYIPCFAAGFLSWRKNTDKEKKEIKKTKLKTKEKAMTYLFSFCLCAFSIYILTINHDKSPILDGIITSCSITAMYLTVKRSAEQWIFWTIVNLSSIFMWIDLIIKGQKAYSTVLVYFIYLFLGIWFYFRWSKELKTYAKSTITTPCPPCESGA